jgi:hypothetical protein
MVFLKFVGTEGTGASNANQRHTFAIGYGTADKYRRRVTKALLQFRDKYIHWPDGMLLCSDAVLLCASEHKQHARVDWCSHDRIIIVVVIIISLNIVVVI